MESLRICSGGNLFERRNKHYTKTLQPSITMVGSVDVTNTPTVTPNQYVTDKILHFLQLSSVSKDAMDDTLDNVEEVLSTTELDSHASSRPQRLRDQ